ncbi:MAG TPA: hypothetical protein PK511_08555 [Chitinophagales bacterium]|nr:hypothetical protein [Chitinophagales bacterium]HMU69101.1 hypothetical protein [Chitinophagales bacterium]HMZ89920.1 hypothetical protein [Chitinophagales bacterium]HNA58185.1 hypothetical protein [Chitinophagales bacterium]HNI54558.1 hypothetical protein [Chitinophagales bacterium]
MPSSDVNGFNKTMGLIVAFIGLPVCFIGLTGYIAIGRHGMGWIFLILALSGITIIAGGVQMFFQGRADAAKQREVLQAAKAGKAESQITKIITEWPIDDKTWADFCINEKHYRRGDNYIFFFMFLAIGSFILVASRGSGLLLAVCISGVIGLITVILRYNVAMKKVHTISGIEKKVIIGKRYIIMNGILYPINNERMTTHKIQLITTSIPAILEFTIYWPTRSGETFDELRIPVPDEAISNAKLVVNSFTSN